MTAGTRRRQEPSEVRSQQGLGDGRTLEERLRGLVQRTDVRHLGRALARRVLQSILQPSVPRLRKEQHARAPDDSAAPDQRHRHGSMQRRLKNQHHKQPIR